MKEDDERWRPAANAVIVRCRCTFLLVPLSHTHTAVFVVQQ